MVRAISNKDELVKELVDAGNKLVVIDFFATWCGPCKLISPQIDKLETQLTDVVFLKVDVDEAEDLASEYEITAMPTFVLIKDKKKLECFAGANFEKLKTMINDHK